MELDFVLLSNGVLISEKVAKILKEKDLRVAVSLDGSEKILKHNIPFAFNFYHENPYISEEVEFDDKKLVFFLKKAY